MAKAKALKERPIVLGKSRRCDNCPKMYRPRTREHRFCSAACRADFHKFGPILMRVRDRIDAEIGDQVVDRIESMLDQVRFEFWKILGPPDRARYRDQFPEQARRILAIEADAA